MESDGLNQIVSALGALHSSSSNNDQRREAQNFLEELKGNNNAPYWGQQLASAQSNNDCIVRHYGLSLLQHAISYNFPKYDEEKRQAIRYWVEELATGIQKQDPHYIKEKISALWVAVAKRVWGLVDQEDGSNSSDGWQGMDAKLHELWLHSEGTREFTLSVFRTLFEDLFILDDQVAAKRSTVLSAQCMEIVTSVEDLKATYEERLDDLKSLKHGDDGWLNRWAAALNEALANNSLHMAAQLMETLKTCLYWVIPRAIRNARLLETLSMALEVNSVNIRTLATDCLHVLFTRNFGNTDDYEAIVGAVFLPAGLNALSRVFDSVTIDLDDFEEPSYILLRKLVEMIVGLGENLNARSRLSKDADVSGYLDLVLKTTLHESLVVSGFSLQFWCSVLRADKLMGSRDYVTAIWPRLLEAAAARCIKYEDVGEDHVSQRYLEIDFDSTQEIQSFLGNYRRFVEDIIRLGVSYIPCESMKWLKQNMEQFFNTPQGWDCLNKEKLVYEGNPSFYMGYAQLRILDSALRGAMRWKIMHSSAVSPEPEVEAELDAVVADWCPKVTNMTIKDPQLVRKLVQAIVQFTPLFKARPGANDMMFMVLEKVLTCCTSPYPTNATDEDRELVRELRQSCGTELNRLAYMIPKELMHIYDDLERVIGNILSSNELSEHEVVAFKSFLLVVSQRSNMPTREEKFAKIVDPVLSSWSDEDTMRGLADLQWFMARVGIVKIAEYFRSRGVTADTDLLATPIDDQGRALKAELKASWSAIFPIRPTRIFIQYTIEKIAHSSTEFADLLKLWKPRIQQILPHILQLTAQIEAYHNPQNWSDLPPEVQTFVRYSTQERFWQVGVSTQTRDEFVEDSMQAMNTLRDFADSVGHIIRYTREYCFLTLGSLSQLDDTMYEIPGMGSNLYNALAGDSDGITSHAWRHMISLSLRGIIKNCPPQYVGPFMTEFLPPMLTKIDQVLTTKWAKVVQNGVQLDGNESINNDDSLSNEMMEEHLLRQLTAIVDRLLIDLAGQHGTKSSAKEAWGDERVLHEVVLEEKSILAPFLTLNAHILAFKDVRCSFNVALILRNIVPRIISRDTEVDEFLCETLLPTCLQLIQDPYFTDVHNEAGYLIIVMYKELRAKHQRPLEVLAQAMPNATTEDLSDFEVRLANTKSARQQRGLLMDFCSRMQGTVANDDGSEARAKARLKAEKKNDKNKWLSKKQANGNLMDEDGLENNALSGLFGEQG